MDRDSQFPASFEQERAYVLDQLREGDPALNLHEAVVLRGSLTEARVREALDRLTARHEILRTGLAHTDGALVQTVHAAVKPELSRRQLAEDEGEQEAEARAKALVEEFVSRRFDLERAPLWRMQLVRLRPDRHLVVVCMHAAIADAATLRLFLVELLELLELCGEAGEGAPAAEVDQYRWYAGRQRDLGESRLREQEAYWIEQLGEDLRPSELPTFRRRDEARPSEAGLCRRVLPSDVVEAAEELAAGTDRSLSEVLEAAFAALLYRYGAQAEVTFGHVQAPAWERLRGMGPRANLTVLRLAISERTSFEQALGLVGESLAGAAANSDYPFQRLSRVVEIPRDSATAPLLPLAFGSELDLPPLRGPGSSPADELEVPPAGADHDVQVVVRRRGDEVVLDWILDTRIHDQEPIAQAADHHLRLLRAALADPGAPLLTLDYLDEADMSAIRRRWNTVRTPYPDVCVHRLIEREVRRAPEAIAVEFEGEELTYDELNKRANRLARRLRAEGAEQGAMVGICLDRSAEMVVAVLATFKAGCAVVPLDPAYPRERLTTMIEDAEVGMVITDRAALDSVAAPDEPFAELARVELDAGAPAIAAMAADDLEESPGSDAVAYCIFTSGSTGRPKGVVVEHAALVNLVSWHREAWLSAPGTRTLLYSPFSFDVSFHEILAGLCSGATLVQIDEETRRNPIALLEFACERRIEKWYMPYVTLQQVAQAARTAPAPETLEELIVGGEVLRITPEIRDFARQTGCVIHNHYGSTECIDVATCTLSGDPGKWPNVAPVGRAGVHNMNLYILDEARRPVPIGVVGELYGEGDCLARGYSRSPEMTEERFLSSPFGVQGDRLYRLGDLGRYLPDGTIECLGRADQQVKIRGFRVEPGEVEAVLLEHPVVAECVVAAKPGPQGRARLVAYVVLAETEDAETLPERLRAVAAERLPDFMVPAAVVPLDAMPMTPSGKIAVRRLPAEPSRPPRHPRRGGSELAEKLAGIWRDVLELSDVDPRKTFFELGGDSVLLVQAHQLIAEAIGRELRVETLFRYPTLEALVEHLEEAPGSRRVGTASASARAAGADGDRDVAIVGMACRVPGAANLAEFWANLRDGVESVRRLGEEEIVKLEPDQTRDPHFVPVAAAIPAVDRFDAGLFGYSAAEAATIDPQQRLFLECAWEALEDAGVAAREAPVGVYAGSSLGTYLINNVLPAKLGAGPFLSHRHFEQATDLRLEQGNAGDHLPTRVSFKLDLRGPSVNVQSTCSTSLVAVHMARQALLDGECEVALAGGVSIITPQETGYLWREGMMLSPDGHCRAFDADAAGTVFGNGLGAVVLKPLSAALADGDQVYAVLKGSAVNNDGHGKLDYSGPSVEAQAEVIARAHESAGVGGDEISYVEAHGTGTKLGDPIEIAGLKEAFARTSRGGDVRCAIGSAKTNLGHLDEAAGVVGLIKTALALDRREIPPSLNFSSPNPLADLEGGPFFVNSRLRDWTVPAGRRRLAGVSSFGMGGTNCHVVLEETPPPDREEPADERPLHVLPISARSAEALRANGRRYLDRLAGVDDDELADVSFSAATGRRHLDRRLAVVAGDAATARAELEALVADPDLGGAASAVGGRGSGVAFLFTGQGSQYPGMGRSLYETQPVYRQAIESCDEILRPLIDRSLVSLLYGDEAGATIDETGTAQPALFAVGYALSRLWDSWGVEPVCLVGHSLGECVAACVAGVFSLEDGLRLVAARGRLMQELPLIGGMAQVGASEDAVAPHLRGFEADVSIASVNGPQATVISGRETVLDEVCERLRGAGIDSIGLNVSHAFHSPLMEPMLEQFREVAETLGYQPPRLDVISNVTGEPVRPGEMDRADYWVRHVRQPVRFDQTMREVEGRNVGALLEIGPKPTLIALGREREGSEGVLRLPSLTPKNPAAAIDSLAKLYLAGTSVDWAGFHAPFRRRRVRLPTYAFQRERHWLEPDTGGVADKPAPAEAPEPDRAQGVETFAPAWEPVAPPVAQARAGRHCVVIGEDDLAAGIAGRLEAAGHRCRTVAPDAPGLAAAVAGEREPWVIFAPAATDTGDVARATRMAADVGVILGRLVDAPAVKGFWLVTRQSRPGVPANEEELGQAGAAALVRTIAAEHPDIACASLAVPPEWGEADLDLAAALIGAGDVAGGEQFAIHDERVQRARLRPLDGADRSASELPIRADGVYLITGGTGGIGLRLALEIARRRPKRVVLASRSGAPASTEAATWERLIATGTRIATVPVDVSDEADLARVVDDCGPDLRGVFHCAGVLEDGIMLRQTPERLATVMRPKAEGAWHLHRLTRGIELDLFVLFSSLASLVGYRGQGGYALANGFLDGLALHRQSHGLPALSVSWGSWAGAGMTAAMGEEHRARSREEGERPIATDEGMAALAGLIAGHEPHAAVAAMDWKLFAASRAQPPPLLEPLTDVARDRRPAPAGAFAKKLRQAPSDEARKLLRERVTSIVEDLLGGGKRVEPDRGFEEMGLDSLGALDLRERLQADLGLRLPATLAFEQPTLDALVSHLEDQPLDAAIDVGPAVEPENGAGETRVLPAPEGAVAIVGMSCRFPGADSPAELWELLAAGRDAVAEIPAERWPVDDVFDPDPDAPGKAYVRHAALIEDPDCFDAEFFGISPREASSMDPRHRLLLEEAWSAIEAAGIDPDSLVGSDTAVYLGGDEFVNDYLHQAAGELGSEPYLATGTTLSFGAGRLSYKLGLHGPSMVVATACSSSLVALHSAVRAIRQGDCGMALVGGARILLGPEDTVQLCRLKALSPDGHSKAFSAEADGFGRGEGAGAVLLKPLERAEADGDPILAVIRGSAVNHDGPSSGLTVPSGSSQRRLIDSALADAGLEPADVTYLETHGTGTQLGDPIEVRAIGEAFAERSDPLLIGSVKANVGHLEEAAGLAGLIKVVLALRHDAIPPQIHCAELNDKVEWDDLPVEVPRDGIPWPAERPRVAGLSSFGMSGTNAHVVLEAAPPSPARPSPPGPFVFPFSARDEEDLMTLVGRFADSLTGTVGEAQVAATLQVGRRHHRHRLAVVCGDTNALRESLRAIVSGRESEAEVARGDAGSKAERRRLPAEEVAALLADGRRAELARLWCDGHEVDWEPLCASVPRIPLPSYPFKRERLWIGDGRQGSYPSREQEEAAEPTATGLLDELREQVAELLGTRAEKVPTTTPLEELGADSLVFMRLSRFVGERFGTKISFQELVEEAGTVEELAAAVSSRSGAVATARTGPAPAPAAPPQRDEPVFRSGPTAIAGAAPTTARLNDRQAAFVEELAVAYAERTSGSKAAAQRDRPVMANCRMLPFQQLLKETNYPIVAERSRGSRFWDVDGNEYLDISMGYGVHLFGHQPDFVVTALRAQLEKGIHIGPQASLAGEVARLLCELTGMSRAVFCNSGTEAVMAALRLARAATGRTRFVMFEGSYHGWSDNTLALPAGPSGSVAMARGIGAGAMEDVVVLEYGAPESLEEIRRLGPELGAVLVEPVQSRRPDLQPVGFLEELRALTHASGTALVFDEVITGFRLGPGGAQAWCGVEADLAVYGKILGAGMPIGAVAGSSKFLDTVDGGDWSFGDDSAPTAATTFFGGTFNKNPMSMAAAHAVLSRVAEDPDQQERIAGRAAWLEEDFNAFCRREGFPMRIVRFGSLFRFIGEGDYSLQRFPVEIELFFQMLALRGVYVLETRVCFLSAGHDEEDVRRVSETAKQCLVDLREAEFFGGVGPASEPSGRDHADRLLEDARRELPVPASPASSKPAEDVLLTGATGFLGAWLATDLLIGTDARVHCLVRAEDPERARARLIDSVAGTGRWESGWEKRLIAVPGNLASRRLALDDEAWRRLADGVDAIYHSGAQVNSLHAYGKLRAANVEGTRELLCLAATGRSKAFHHVSSDAVFEAYGYLRQSTLYEDQPLDHCGTLFGGGYAETKWVADKMVEGARGGGLQASIYRPGPVTGALEGGCGQVDDFLGRFIRGNLELGIWPDIEATIDIAPVDLVSRMIVELSQGAGAGTFHLTHPQPVRCREFVEAIRDAGHELEVVPVHVWEAVLRDLSFESDNPLLPLLPLLTENSDPLFRSARLDVGNASAGAPALASRFPPVEELVSLYLERYAAEGHLSPRRGSPAGSAS